MMVTGRSDSADCGRDGGEQGEVIAFLASPDAYPLRPSPVARCETHAALVFLAGEEAYKIKRAVRFDYLDFSTLELRRRVIEREAEVNRRFAPDIYLGVVPITRQSDGSLAIGGGGTPVEWALHMRRFSQDDLLSAVADRGALTCDLATRLADVVADAQVRLEPVTCRNGAARIAAALSQVETALAVSPGHAPSRVEVFRGLAGARLASASAVLDARAVEGYVRRCHGDLHLSNIVLWRGEPVLFDAIEFSEELATIDVFYDLAFLLMDLDARGAGEAANRVLNRYLARRIGPHDIEGLAALPLFLSLRAGIRAMVNAQRSEQETGAARERDIERAKAYLERAIAYLSPKAPVLIAVGGFSGTGKSTLSARLAPLVGAAPGALHIRADVERKALFGVDEAVRLDAAAYRNEVSARVYAVMYEKAARALRAGHSAMLDGVFARPSDRKAAEAIARAAGTPFEGLWLQTSEEVMLRRVSARTGDASDATPQVVAAQLAAGAGVIDWSLVEAGGVPEATLAAACGIVSAHLR